MAKRKNTHGVYFFKLFDNLSNEIEVKFAKMEISGLFPHDVKSVKNVIDIMDIDPINPFVEEDVRIQDRLTWHLPPGNIHGFIGKGNLCDISKLITRLAYVREVYVFIKSPNKKENLLKALYPSLDANAEKNFQYNAVKHDGKKYHMFRFISSTFFLENMHNVILCSSAKTKKRQYERIEENLSTLFEFVRTGYQYYPLFPDSSVWKEFEDFVEARTEIKLYLSHGFGSPYKGKFHPRMVKALINYSGINSGVVLDPFAGSGTTPIECTLMGLDSIGIEMNPFCVKTIRGKIAALKMPDTEKLNVCVNEIIKGALKKRKTMGRGQTQLTSYTKIDDVKSQEVTIPENVASRYKGKEDGLLDIYALKSEILKNPDENTRYFCYSALGKVISEFRRRKNIDPIASFEEICYEMSKNVFGFNRLKNELGMNIGSSHNYIGDVKNMSKVNDNSVDLIITSPPYSTAIDYVENDRAQLEILEESDLNELNENIIGTPKTTISDKKDTLESIEKEEGTFCELPKDARKIIKDMVKHNRKSLAVRQYEYLVKMKSALKEMNRTLRKNSLAIIIIGNNNFKVNDKPSIFKNDEYLKDLGEKEGFVCKDMFERRLTKTTYGAIRTESVLVLQKQA
ncbi:MAG: hypothetical protein JSV09_09105 [Thermoplasmata archaeon]|nr:MAG: hypothetical protein JSV09_09105 [Thermoplasmata archaeon]